MGRRLAREAPIDPEDDYVTDEYDERDDEYVDKDDLKGASEPRRGRSSDRGSSQRRTPRRDNSVDDSDEPRRERPRFRRADESGSSKPQGRHNSSRDRSRGDDDDRGSRKRSEGDRSVIGHGFGSYKEAAAKRKSGFARLEVPEGGKKRKLIKILESEPFAHYYVHWIEKRPYTCLGDECALCSIGDISKPVMLYNVVDIDEGLVKVWNLSKDPAKALEERYDQAKEDGKTIDDPNLYFAVSKKQDQNTKITHYKVDVIKARDVEEDFGFEPLDDEELDDYMDELYDDSVVFVSSAADLQRVADDLTD